MATGKSGAIRAGNAFVQIFTDNNPLERGLKEAQHRLREFGSKVSGIGRGLFGVGAAALAATVPMVKLAADSEKAAISFEVLLGSAERAKQVMEDLNRFAASTPFELPELTDATRKLLAFGVTQEDLIDSLRAVGDVAAGIDAPISEIAEIYGKAKVQGRLFMEDINQLTGRGIPIIQELAAQFGVAESEVRGLVSSGQVNFGHLETAFQSLSGEGGKFAGMMDRLSQSTAGRWSTLMDTLAATDRTVGESLIPVLKPILDDTAKVAEVVAGWSAENRELTKSVAGVAAAIAASGGLLWAFGAIATALSGPVGVIVLVTGLTAALVKAAEAYGVFGTSAADAARQQALFRSQLAQGAKARAEVNNEENAAAIEAGPEAVEKRRRELGDDFRDLQKQMADQSKRIEEMKAGQGWFISQGEEDELQVQVDHLEDLQQRMSSVVDAREELEAALKGRHDAAVNEVLGVVDGVSGKVGSAFDSALGSITGIVDKAAELGIKPQTTKGWVDGLIEGVRNADIDPIEEELAIDENIGRLRRSGAINTGAVVGSQSSQDAILRGLNSENDPTTKATIQVRDEVRKVGRDMEEIRRKGGVVVVGKT